MKIRNIHISEECMLRRREDQEKEISRMYPDCNEISNKYKLFIKFDLWEGIYDSNDIEAVVEVAAENKLLELPRYKLRHLYPNKHYHTICMKSGNKLCNDGIILLFETFEELEAIKSILCRWKISRDNEDVHYIQILYDVTAEKESGKTFYILESQEVCDVGYLYSERAKKSVWQGLEKMKEYDRIFRIWNRYEKESLSINYLYGEVPEEEEAVEELFITFFNNVTLQEFMDKSGTQQQQIIDCYYSKVSLKPDVAAIIL